MSNFPNYSLNETIIVKVPKFSLEPQVNYVYQVISFNYPDGDNTLTLHCCSRYLDTAQYAYEIVLKNNPNSLVELIKIPIGFTGEQGLFWGKEDSDIKIIDGNNRDTKME
jgi:hypothetical protein